MEEYLSSASLGLEHALHVPAFFVYSNSNASSTEAFTTLKRRIRQPHYGALCYSSEGWGPYSSVRPTDLTPCFESAAVAVTALLLLAVGAGTLVAFRRRPRIGRGQASASLLGWKLALFGVLLIVSLAHLILAVLITKSQSLPLLSIDPIAALILVLATALALPLTSITHTHTRRSSDLLLVFWPLFIIISIPKLRTAVLLGLFSRPRDAREVTSWSLEIVYAALGATVFALECLGPEWRTDGAIRLPEGGDESSKGVEIDTTQENPALTANFFSLITFSWLTPLMKLGSTRFIDEDDIFDLSPSDTADVLGARLAHYWEGARRRTHAKALARSLEDGQDGNHKSKKPRPSLFLAVAKAYGSPYLVASFFKLANDCLSFLQPQLLRLLLKFVDSYRTETPDPAIRGVVIALSMFGAACVQTALLHQYFDRAFTTGMRVKAGIITLLYQKALVLSNSERAGRATGDIVNLQSVDALRLSDLCQYGQMAWSGPVQITLAFVSLYNLLGWPAFCGVAVMVVSLPLNAAIARYQKKLQVKQMKIKDKRTRLMNEILSNIKSIKLYSWEKAFSAKVLDVRNTLELVMVRRIGIVNAISNFFWASTPFMVAFATFAAYAYTSTVPLTSAVIFPAISLFTLLQFPLAMFSMIISSIIEATVSEGRLVDFLDAEELQPDARTVNLLEDSKNGDELVMIRGGEFFWSTTAELPTLKDINLSVKKGELLAVLGRVGDGKTSLLAAMLGEMTRTQGEVVIRGKIAYFAQQSWVLSATVKDNITFGHSFDPEFYQRVLEACALLPDLRILPKGDLTEVGEKGVSLSGGQKARIALARAVYARADIYLLDDPLCAVDNHVAAHVFEQVLGPRGLLKGKARILCTNSVAFLSQTDDLIMLRRGEIIEQSSYDQVMEARDSPLFTLINGLGKQNGGSTPGTPGEISDDARTAVDDDHEIDLVKLDEKTDAVVRRRYSQSSLQNAPILSIQESKRLAIREMKDSTKPQEAMQRGQVKTHVYSSYISAASTIGVICFLVATFAAQGTSVAGNLVLRAWGERNLSEHKTASIGYYLFWYGAFGIASSALNMIASLLLWAYCAIRCSKKLHDASFQALMRSPMSFFELTPQGRILNLFSRDVYVIDEVLVRTFSGFFRTLASVGGVLVVIGLGAPVVLLGAIPVALMYKTIMRYYLATSRELKRLDATSRAPIFSWFGETLTGLSTIRAYSQQGRFSANNEARLDRNNACFLPSVSVNRWLAVRLELLGSIIMLAAAFVSVIALATARNVDAGLVGLMMTYAVSVTGSLNWVVRSASEVETNIVSVERVMGYGELPSEAADEIPENQPPASWPQKGSIIFENYSTRYREDLPLCIKGLSLEIKAGEKIGICGRTGAGKSSLTLALFRIIEATEGKIEIDGIDISQIGLHDLRSQISIIPQDPQLFEGTLRENVDPTGAYTDVQIWDALDHAHLKPYVENMEGKLDGVISEAGQNLSSGQRQLICFARALLRRSRILVLDEATSAIDLETDAAVQEILRGPDFAETTTITIAHRLDTIMHSTRVLVMDAGAVAEFASPEELLGKRDSIFFSLALQAGLVDTAV